MMNDPRLEDLEARAVIAERLLRFERPRFYAGDYHADFAYRIVEALRGEGFSIVKRDGALVDHSS